LARASGLRGRWARLCTAAVGTPAHALLGLELDANQKQVERAYVDLAIRHRPKRGDDAAVASAAVARLERLGEAYDALTGVSARAAGESMGLFDTLASSPSGGVVAAAVPTGAGAPAHVSAGAASVPVSVWLDQLVRMPAYVPPPLRRLAESMARMPNFWDQLLGHTYDSMIHKLLRDDNLAEAFDCFKEMKEEGENPTAATYEMLIRGCTLAMRRVTPDEPTPDRLTEALYGRVISLWGEMQERKIRVDSFTYTELLRSFGKAGHVDASRAIFFKMLTLPQFLPSERAFDSMYELCTHAGEYELALDVFKEQCELRKSLFAPRFSPVAFTHLMVAGVEGGQMGRFGPVLEEMQRFRTYPAVGTFAKLLGAALEQGELKIAEQVIQLTRQVGHVPDRLLLDNYEAARRQEQLGGSRRTPKVTVTIIILMTTTIITIRIIRVVILIIVLTLIKQ